MRPTRENADVWRQELSPLRALYSRLHFWYEDFHKEQGDLRSRTRSATHRILTPDSGSVVEWGTRNQDVLWEHVLKIWPRTYWWRSECHHAILAGLARCSVIPRHSLSTQTCAKLCLSKLECRVFRRLRGIWPQYWLGGEEVEVLDSFYFIPSK